MNKLYFFFVIYKNEWNNLLSKKQRKNIKQSKKYYENNQEVLREKARNKYTEPSDEEINIKKEYGNNRYHNMSKEKKQRLKEYQRDYREANKGKKSWFLSKQYINSSFNSYFNDQNLVIHY